MNYSNKEMMAFTIANQIKDNQIVIAGTGLPLVGATLAKRTNAPNCKIIVESGIIDCSAGEVPTSVGDLRFMNGAGVLWEEFRHIGFQANSIKYNLDIIAFIGGAEIDPYGNLNSTSIGSYHHPKVRLSGSGGANGIATYFNTIITMKHQKRRFVEKLGFMTSPGWINGKEDRAKKGLSNNGPQVVVTDLGILKFEDETKRMYLAAYYPGIDPEYIKENTGFDIDIEKAIETEAPDENILEILRSEVDPQKIYI